MSSRSTLVLTALALTVAAQEPADEAPAPAPRCSDATQIDWYLPDQFDEALARAKDEQRLLVIKGISFGVDDAGAQCATRGQW